MIDKLKMLGPGILFAGAAIGVSHLVQSTRAGANYGFWVFLIILFANFSKYPFFEFAPRYTAATGESLLDGYKRLGKGAIILYLTVTIATMFTLIAAVTFVTASISSNIFGGGLGLVGYSIIIILVCIIILILGRYKFLDNLVKVVIVILSISTITAAILAITGSPIPDQTMPPIWDDTGILFLIAVIGWMPTTLDIAVWQSVWILEQKREQEVTVKSALFDFNVGYLGTAFLAFFFMALGAILMFGSGQSFSAAGTAFANELISLYTDSIGPWAKPIIQIAAFTAMFSTTLTCLDGFPRSLTHLITLYKKPESVEKKRHEYWAILIFLSIGSVLVISYFISSLKLMVDVATISSCLVTPVLAYLNYKVITGKNVPDEHKPPKWLMNMAYVCFVLLLSLPALFVYSLL
jgi:Mn2+/Fe2+ NRAMP family transporter